MSDPTLTPYDTGARLEPKLWVSSVSGLTRSYDNTDEFGRVDFDTDEGSTAFTVYAEPSENGAAIVLHIAPVTHSVTVVFDHD